MPHQDDQIMLKILRALGYADVQIRHLIQIRERNDRAPIEQTVEACRLEFWRREREAGRLTDGVVRAEAPTMGQVMDGIDFAGGEAQRRPEYTGGGSYPADDPEDHGG